MADDFDEGDIKVLANEIKRNNELTAELVKIIKGDNGPGLMTKIALQAQSIARLWWIVAFISTSIIGTAFWVIRSKVMG